MPPVNLDKLTKKVSPVADVTFSDLIAYCTEENRVQGCTVGSKENTLAIYHCQPLGLYVLVKDVKKPAVEDISAVYREQLWDSIYAEMKRVSELENALLLKRFGEMFKGSK